jgi:hypothetical protein
MDLLLMDTERQFLVDNQYRQMYDNFLRVFGENSFGVVYPEDVRKEMEGGQKSVIYNFDKDMNIRLNHNRGLESQIFLARSFTNLSGVLPQERGISEIMEYLEMNKKIGKIGNLLNSKKGTLGQKDKLKDMEVSALGINAPLTYHFKNYEDFLDKMEESNREYILKHRFGSDGIDVRPVDRGNLSKYNNLNFENYVLQEKLDIKSESRMIFLNGEFLGSRMIYDRTSPWEQKGSREHRTQNYKPTKLEIEESKKIMDSFDIKLGCVDWVYVGRKKDRLYLEVNGVATGLGEKGYVYDLNSVVAEKLRTKYLSPVTTNRNIYG